MCVFVSEKELQREGGGKKSWKVKEQMRLLQTHCLAAWLHHLPAAADVCM